MVTRTFYNYSCEVKEIVVENGNPKFKPVGNISLIEKKKYSQELYQKKIRKDRKNNDIYISDFVEEEIILGMEEEKFIENAIPVKRFPSQRKGENE